MPISHVAGVSGQVFLRGTIASLNHARDLNPVNATNPVGVVEPVIASKEPSREGVPKSASGASHAARNESPVDSEQASRSAPEGGSDAKSSTSVFDDRSMEAQPFARLDLKA